LSYLSQLLLLLGIMWYSSQPLGHIPKRDIDALRLKDQMEAIGLLPDSLQLVLDQFHEAILLLLEALGALGPPLEPQLEDVVVPSALDHLVSGIVANIILLVGHEQILGRHLIAADEETLRKRYNTYIDMA